MLLSATAALCVFLVAALFRGSGWALAQRGDLAPLVFVVYMCHLVGSVLSRETFGVLVHVHALALVPVIQ